VKYKKGQSVGFLLLYFFHNTDRLAFDC